ncbi:MAG: DUF3618 domain-containing protein [Streptosporangiaceae bacterium]
MADQDGAVEAQGTVAMSGSVAKPGPDMIVAEIERTRENLARTIDALTEKVSPANNVRRLKERVAEQVARPDIILGAVAVGLALAGLTIYRLWGRRR